MSDDRTSGTMLFSFKYNAIFCHMNSLNDTEKTYENIGNTKEKQVKFNGQKMLKGTIIIRPYALLKQ